MLIGLPSLVSGNEQWQDENIYYILIDRFSNGSSTNDFEIDIENPNAYHGGDLQGIINHLGHIKELGFTTINLSPVMSNEIDGYHGFLIDDFRSVEEHFGTIEDVKELVDSAHDMELKVTFDFVVSHLSKTHNWVNENNDWIDGEVSNRWGDNLPSPALQNTEVEQYFLDTAAFWIEETNVDGFRLYVDEQTPDPFIARFIDHVKMRNANTFVFIDERNFNPMKFPVGYYDQEAVNVFRQAGQPLTGLLKGVEQNQPKITYVDSIETTRFTREAIKQGQNPITRWKLALTYLYTTPGTPMIYQGTEIPMDNGEDTPDHQMIQIKGGDEELTAHIQQLAAIRKQFPAITNGDFAVEQSNGAMSLYKRTNRSKTVYVAINNDTQTKTITIENIPDGMQLTGLIQDNIVREQENGEFRIVLDRETADIFIVEEDTGLNWLFLSFIAIVMAAFIIPIIYLSRKNKKKSSE